MEEENLPEEANPDCIVTDSAEEMVKKLERFLDSQRIPMLKLACMAGQKSSRKLLRTDRGFTSAMLPMHLVSCEAMPEYLLPREIIRPDEKELMHLRDLMDACVVQNKPAMRNKKDYRHPRLRPDERIPAFVELPELRERLLPADEFKRRVENCASYQAMHEMQVAMERLLEECLDVAQRSCGHRCGKFGAEKQCTKCHKFYCSDSCLHDHTDLNQCKQAK